jgi:polyisoprenoid-binding protein YceI
VNGITLLIFREFCARAEEVVETSTNGVRRQNGRPNVSQHQSTTPSDTDFDPATTALSDVTGDYTVDASHSRIGFSARHAMVTTVRGTFTDFASTAHLDLANPAASHVSIAIETASINTGSPDRDGHLRSGDFFDTETYPQITFESTNVTQIDEDTYRVTGDLTVKDTTRLVAVDFTLTGSAQDPFGNLRVGFEGALVIKRSEFGLTWNAALETGGVLVSDKIKIEFDVSAIKNA